ncbi:MAG: tRNA lysidine(34) synthetase TilS [Proteobacteria bacterium]|nr:tRNA lysidine(34) synthetase TilS [Pseudomonadota bacterium]MBU1594630.1 tRNA lysidine(34) synthetase TilS [Pseudomonadota bacterium]
MNTTAQRLQDLPRPAARFCLGIGRFAGRELGCDFPALRCLVACSGGADSTALLLVAKFLCQSRGGSVVAAHLDHSLRQESPADASFVANLCAVLDVALISERQDIAALAQASGLGLEEAGRNARYGFLERARRETGADIVLVAHQLNDLAEDQLMRLMRGSGWPALGGMAGHDAQRSLLRPLLLSPRAALEDFLKILKQTWRVDGSNFDRATTRNRVRHELLPNLLSHNPCYLDGVARLWRQARMDGAHWDQALSRLLPQVRLEKGRRLIPASALSASPAPLRLRLYKAVLETAGPGQSLCDALFRLDELWVQRASGKSVRFPGDKEARISRAGVVLQVIDRKKECG